MQKLGNHLMRTDSQRVLIETEHLDLVLQLRYHRSLSWRDVFVEVGKSPIESLFPEADTYQVLRDVNLSIHSGDRVGIIGINGSGKTTLCRCLAGMFVPSRGAVHSHCEVQGVFDTTVGIKSELTGRENAFLLARLMFPYVKDVKPIAEEALSFAELGGFEDIAFKWYSKGMQTRLCLSLISSSSHELLILDEVFTGADQYFSEKVEKRVLKMIYNSGGVIFVSHSMDQVKRVCNRVILINEGTIAFDGAVEEGINRYQKITEERTRIE